MKPVRFGLFVPQGWIMDLVDIEDPIEQYETMSRVAQTAERLGFDSIWPLRSLPHLLQGSARDDVSSAGRRLPPWLATPGRSGSARWSRATATETRR